MIIKDNSQRSKLAIYFVTGSIFFEVVNLVMAIAGVVVMDDISSGMYDANFVESFTTFEQIIGIVYLGMRVGTCIVFIHWFRRAYYNVHEFALTPLKYSEGWAAGAWFVPIMHLFRPVQIMREIWLETISYLRLRSPLLPRNNIQTLITLWWISWISAGIIANFTTRMSQSESIDVINGYYYAQIGIRGLFVVAGVFLIIIIKEFAELEQEVLKVKDLEQGESDSIFY